DQPTAVDEMAVHDLLPSTFEHQVHLVVAELDEVTGVGVDAESFDDAAQLQVTPVLVQVGDVLLTGSMQVVTALPGEHRGRLGLGERLGDLAVTRTSMHSLVPSRAGFEPTDVGEAAIGP